MCISEEYEKRKADEEKANILSNGLYKEFLEKQGNRPGLPGWFSF